MKIAIPIVDNNGIKSKISEHFGHSPFFAFVTVENNEIVSHEIEANPFEQHEPGEIPGYVKSKGANVIITRGMGGRARQFFETLGVHAITGASGTVEALVRTYIEGELSSVEYEPEDHGKFHNH
ncbi:NifB/NifX family molybdenum-iron cluster-binding protein [Mesotoga sp. B105.6.4]|uniref:NifB/NifX family molybdenum-iron cluster-binding protein n=1 Tax=Mesotoga sp. B105.6.4 TaxID=1582224 RepID=UPI000CCC3AF1|nr:NifB/NifX family molybdenum-iron cluster-binding protein [Mesotoga sp. B105.6.4]PNS35947.1 dinitrogenase iron-molybdenum cofactor biosynthesis protein [Mesotoga sp. B105.6.4]